MKKLTLMFILTLFPQFSFGEISLWKNENCKISAYKSGVYLSTDARVQQNKLMMRLSLPYAVKGYPRVEVNTDSYQVLTLEGTGKVFSFFLDFYPHSVAKLLKEEASFMISFPSNLGEELLLAMPTKGLYSQVKELQKKTNCSL